MGTSPGTGSVYSTPQTHYVLQNLDLSTTYYWRIRARRDCGSWSAWSGSRSFSTEVDEYTYTSLVAPAERAHCQPYNGTMLQWEAIDQASYYEVQISDNWCYEGTIYQPAGPQLYLSNLTPNTTYYWRVRSMSECGTYTNWSSVPGFCYTFKTGATFAAAPVPNMPYNGSTCASPDPYLQWNHTEDWDTYEVQVGTSCGTGTISTTGSNGTLFDQDPTTIPTVARQIWEPENTFETSDPLADGVHWFHVRSIDQAGNWAPGAVHFGPIQIDTTAPTVPAVAADLAIDTWLNAAVVNATWLSTDDGSGVDGYRVAFDQNPTTNPTSFTQSTGISWAINGDGSWYIHVQALDLTGKLSAVEHYGPILIDTTAPVIDAAFPVADGVNAGETYEIQFAAGKVPDPNVFSGELKFSSDGGQSFQTVVDLTEEHFGTKRVEWTAPFAAISQAVLRLCVRDVAGNESFRDSDVFTVHGTTAIGDAAPATQLVGNFPNPFNPRTTIRYSLRAPQPVTLEVFDPRGRLVRSLVDKTQAAGGHQAVWDGTDGQGRLVPSGVYFYRLRAGNLDETRNMVLVK